MAGEQIGAARRCEIAVVTERRVVLVGRSRSLVVVGARLSGGSAIAVLAVLSSAINTVALEVRVVPVRVLLAVAAESAKTGVTHNEQEAVGEATVSAALKNVARVPKGGAGVACAALQITLARSVPPKRAV